IKSLPALQTSRRNGQGFIVARNCVWTFILNLRRILVELNLTFRRATAWTGYFEMRRAYPGWHD
ncbi:MAG: hypothetical protein WCG75_12300, partial [Armatimonadota bacterium]